MGDRIFNHFREFDIVIQRSLVLKAYLVLAISGFIVSGSFTVMRISYPLEPVPPNGFAVSFTGSEMNDGSIWSSPPDTYVIVRYSTGCGNCRLYAPIWARVASSLTEGSSLRFFGLCDSDRESINEFSLDYGLSFPTILDYKRAISRRNNINLCPAIVLVSKEGVVIYASDVDKGMTLLNALAVDYCATIEKLISNKESDYEH
jgi:thiol-disulfide isomerase/thioredoxin